MQKIKKFIDCFVPVYNCNFKCNYCYISTWTGWEKKNKSQKINYEPSVIRKALSIERWGGPLMLNFCGAGETLLCNELLPIVKELLKEGHYCMIVTNGVLTPKFKEIASWDEELKKRLFIKFSYHFLELRRMKFTKRFFDNVNLMKKSKISFTVEVTPSDEYIPYIEDIKKECLDYTGAFPHITVCRIENGDVPIMSNLNKEDFIKTWSTFDSKLFDFKIKIFGEKRKEFCYAGKWTYALDLADGILKQCYRGKVIQNIYEDLNSPIKQVPIGCHCIDAHCWNGHAFLAFGAIKELETPTFFEERNRHTKNGDWITEDMAAFMSSKLEDSNEELTEREKVKVNRSSKRYKYKLQLKENIKKLIGK